MPVHKLYLVPKQIDQTLVDFAKEFLRCAEEGRITGVAAVVLEENHTYSIVTVGSRMSAFESSGALNKLNQTILSSI